MKFTPGESHENMQLMSGVSASQAILPQINRQQLKNFKMY